MALTAQNARRYADQGLTTKEIAVKTKTSEAKIVAFLEGYTPQKPDQGLQPQTPPPTLGDLERVGIEEARAHGWPLLEVRGKLYCARYWKVLPELSAEKYAALKLSIQEKGRVEQDILIDDSALPVILDGYHRAKICTEIEPAPLVSCKVRPGLDDDQKLALAFELNTQRRQLSPEELREKSLALKKEHHWSNPRIASVLGVNQSTVWRWLQGEELPAVVVDKNGQAQASAQAPKKASEAPVDLHRRGEFPVFTPPKGEAQRAARCDEEGHTDCQATEADLARSQPGPTAPPPLGEDKKGEGTAGEEAPKKGPPAIPPSGFDGWNTPKKIVDLVREFGGNEIALDPCSNEFSVVDAKISLTQEDDGLHRDWAAVLETNGLANGLVWVNPPYDQETLEEVFAHCAHQHNKGVEILCIAPTKSDQDWYQLAMGHASSVCFVKGRVPFGKEGDWTKGGAAFACVIFHWGADTEGFCSLFSQLGSCLDLTLYRQALRERENE